MGFVAGMEALAVGVEMAVPEQLAHQAGLTISVASFLSEPARQAPVGEEMAGMEDLAVVAETPALAETVLPSFMHLLILNGLDLTGSRFRSSKVLPAAPEGLVPLELVGRREAEDTNLTNALKVEAQALREEAQMKLMLAQEIRAYQAKTVRSS
jgi:hypothetical protein